MRIALAAVVVVASLTLGASTATAQPAGFRQSQTDPTVWTDADGKTFVVEPRQPDPVQADLDDTPVAAATIPDSQAFLLHSNPGSKRVIYLDFNGQVIVNTVWNHDYTHDKAFTAPPYNTDGDATTFSATERQVIVSVWQRVAEDYSAMDVDVTTQQPDATRITRANTSDQFYGTRAIISPT